MLTQSTHGALAGNDGQLGENGKRLAEAMELARNDFLPQTWELAKTLMYSLALPFSLIHHDAQLRAIQPRFAACERELESLEKPRIAEELDAEGYGNAKSLRYRQEFARRLNDAKTTDDRYCALSRSVDEHQNGVWCAATLFMSLMTAWQNHLGADETAFLALCDRIAQRLNRHLPLAAPDGFSPADFSRIYNFMKSICNITRTRKSRSPAHLRCDCGKTPGMPSRNA